MVFNNAQKLYNVKFVYRCVILTPKLVILITLSNNYKIVARRDTDMLATQLSDCSKVY